MKDPQWTSKYLEMWALAISQYTPLPSQSFLTSDFLLPITLMSNLQHLGMTELVLHPSPFPTVAGVRLDNLHVQLNNIYPFESIRAIFEILGVSVHITLTNWRSRTFQL
jgi:hypothetical protein